MNKGEALIESLISFLIVTLALIPISQSISKTSNTNKKIDIQYIHINNRKNLIEELKALPYDEIKLKEGTKEFNNIKEAYNYFGLNKNNYVDINKKLKVTIKKNEDKYTLYKEEHIYDIKVDEYEDYYIPE